MKRFLVAIATVGALAAAPGYAQAQVQFGGQLSYADDFELGIGARAAYDLADMQEGLSTFGTFDYFFPPGDGVTYFEVNGNIGYDLPMENAPVLPYVGGGINLARWSADDVDSGVELGLNLLGGIGFPLGELEGFAEARLQANGGEQFLISGGVLF